MGVCAAVSAIESEDSAHREHDLRAVFNGVRYVARTGCPWRWMPKDLPPWAAVYQQMRRSPRRPGASKCWWPMCSRSCVNLVAARPAEHHPDRQPDAAVPARWTESGYPASTFRPNSERRGEKRGFDQSGS
jgi:Putative transposase of IS4/5 family (DUF4096)